MKGKSVLVTGVTGFVGGYLARRLIDVGAAVTALVRQPAAAAEFEARGVKLVAGDLCDLEAVDAACQDNEIVIHCAARSGDTGSLSEHYRDNVDGTLYLARAAVRAGCSRLVFLSSISVYGFDCPAVADENTPLPDIGQAYPYAASKITAERALPAFSWPDGMEVVIARVGSVYGPGSLHWTIRPVRVMRIRGVGLFLVDGGTGVNNYIYIDNLVDALLRAAELPSAAGQVFNLTDGAVSFREFFGYYADMLPGRRTVRDLSRRQAMALAYAAERFARLRGQPPLLTRIAIGMLTRRCACPSNRARALLDYQPQISLEQGMAHCQRWLSEQGLL